MTLALRGKALTDSSLRSRKSTDRLLTALVFFLTVLALAPFILGQQYDPSLYSGMQWRQIGPFRAGRVTGVTGVPGQPAIYYVGTAGGGGGGARGRGAGR